MDNALLEPLGILLVDDDERWLDAVPKELSRAANKLNIAIQIETAPSAAEGITKLEQRKFTLVISNGLYGDWILVVNKAKEQAGTRIAVLSGDWDVEQLVRQDPQLTFMDKGERWDEMIHQLLAECITG